jgi:hypothetical protein
MGKHARDPAGAHNIFIVIPFLHKAPYMKSCVSFLLLIILLAACTRHTSTPSCSTAPNTITITDDGNTYCIAGYGAVLQRQVAQLIVNNVAAMCYVSDTFSSLDIVGDGGTFFIDILAAYRHPGSVGTYSLSALDTTYIGFTEKFAGGQSYKISGGTVTVTSADSTRVQATFVLNLFNNSGSKSISGIVKTTSP